MSEIQALSRPKRPSPAEQLASLNSHEVLSLHPALRVRPARTGLPCYLSLVENHETPSVEEVIKAAQTNGAWNPETQTVTIMFPGYDDVMEVNAKILEDTLSQINKAQQKKQFLRIEFMQQQIKHASQQVTPPLTTNFPVSTQSA